MPTIRGIIITRSPNSIFEASAKVDREVGRIATLRVPHPGIKIARDSEDSFSFVLGENDSSILNRKIQVFQEENDQ